MPVPSSIGDLSATPASNSPAGSEAVGPLLDDYLRAIQAIVRQAYDASALKAGSAFTGAVTVLDAAAAQNPVTAVQLQKQGVTAFTSAGTAPTFTLTPVPALTAYAATQRFRVKFNAAGNGSDTLNISGLGAKNLKQYDSTGTKAAPVIAANQLADVEYDGTDFVILDPLPPTPATQVGVRGARAALKSAAAASISLTGTTTSGNNQVTAASTTTGLIISGTYITGAGIPAGTYITNIVGTTLTLSANATASASGVALTAYALNNRTTTADAITISDGAGNYKTLTGVSATGNINTSGANGLDTGTLAASTWYYEHVIYNPTTLTAAKLYSASAAAPTLPSGYTMWARTGAVRTDANKILQYVSGNNDLWQPVVAPGTNMASLPIMASGASGSINTPTWTAVAAGTFVPPTASAIRLVGGVGSVGSMMMAAPNNSYGASSSSTNPPPLVVASNSGNSWKSTAEFLLESSNIYYAGGASDCVLACFGWRDNL